MLLSAEPEHDCARCEGTDEYFQKMCLACEGRGKKCLIFAKLASTENSALSTFLR